MGFAVTTILLDAIGVGLIFPIMPALMLDLGIKNISDAALFGGVLTTVYAAMQFVFMPIFGNLSDRFGRRPVLLLAIATLVVDYIVMGVAANYAVLLIGRVIAGIAGATVSTATAYIADVSRPEDRGKNFGMVGAAFGLGFVLGPALGGMVGEYGVRLPFFLAAGFAGLNFLFGLFFLPESLDPQNRRQFSWERANPFKALKRAILAKELRSLLIIAFCIVLADYVYVSVWSFYGKEKFDWSLSLIGYSLTAYGAGVVLVQGVLIRWMIPKVGEARTIVFGLGVTFLAVVMVAVATETWMVFALMPLVVLGKVAGPALSGVLSKQVPDTDQGDLQGVMGSVASMAAILAPPMFGWLFKVYTTDGMPYFPGAPFLLAAVIMVVALVIFLKAAQRQ